MYIKYLINIYCFTQKKSKHSESMFTHFHHHFSPFNQVCGHILSLTLLYEILPFLDYLPFNFPGMLSVQMQMTDQPQCTQLQFRRQIPTQGNLLKLPFPCVTHLCKFLHHLLFDHPTVNFHVWIVILSQHFCSTPHNMLLFPLVREVFTAPSSSSPV